MLDQVGLTYRVVAEDNLLILTDKEGSEDPVERMIAEVRELHRDVHDLQDTIDEMRKLMGLPSGEGESRAQADDHRGNAGEPPPEARGHTFASIGAQARVGAAKARYSPGSSAYQALRSQALRGEESHAAGEHDGCRRSGVQIQPESGKCGFVAEIKSSASASRKDSTGGPKLAQRTPHLRADHPWRSSLSGRGAEVAAGLAGTESGRTADPG